jgi:Peptidase inhibitor I9
MKNTTIIIVLTIVPLLVVSQISSTLISFLAVYGSTEINSDVAFVANKKDIQDVQGNMSKVWLIAHNNNTNTIKNNNNIMKRTEVEANKTIADQYIITLKDNSITRTPKGLEDVLNNLTVKVESEGAKVIYVYKYSIKGLAIKAPNQQILGKLLNDLRSNSMVASVEIDKSVHAF